METKKENLIELFNELCVLGCSHLYNIFLRGEGGASFLGNIGWVYMGLSIFNILANLSIVLLETLVESFYNFVNNKRNKEIEKLVAERRLNREKITEQLPGVYLGIEKEMRVQDAIKFC